MAGSFDDFFGELEPQTTRRTQTRTKNSLDCPILFCDDSSNLNVLVSEYFSEEQLKYIVSLFHGKGARINLVYVFSAVFDDKKKIVSGMAQFFVENVRSDLTEWLDPKVPIVTIGRAIYATTFDPDVQIQGFYDSVFNNTFFYSPFVNNRIYPIDTIFRICAFGQINQKTGEPIEFYDRWEKSFAENQIERAIKAGNCSLSRKKSIQYFDIDNPNAWLQDHIDSIPEHELWVAVDSETGGFDKLSDPIGDVTFSFDGWVAYHLDWRKVNPRIFTEFMKVHKTIMANCLDGDTLIDTEQGRIKIKDIVNNRMPIKVLSFDDLTGQAVYKRVTNYLRRTRPLAKPVTWYNIEFEYKRNAKSWSNIWTTEDHELYVDQGLKRRADKLSVGDTLLHTGGFNDDMLQFLYGSILGDGSLNHVKSNRVPSVHMSFCHAENQKDYLAWKRNYLIDNGITTGELKFCRYDQIPGHQNQYSFFTESNPSFREISGLSKLEIINRLNIKGLLIYFLDDGTFIYRESGLVKINLACASLKLDEIKLLSDRINHILGEDCTIIRDASGFHSKNGANKNISLNKEHSNKLVNIFSRIQEQELIPYKVKGNGNIKWDRSLRLYPVTIKQITKSIGKVRSISKRTSFDIEVEDTHNFIANGIKSGNCKFDLLFFAYHGCDILIANWDTMIAGHLLNEMRSNSLKTHAFHYTNYGGYDLELEKFKWKYPGLQNYLQIPDSIRIPYACWDAAITYQVWQAQVKAMQKEPDLWEYYHKYCLPMIKVFIKAEYKGFCIDWDKVNEVGGTIQDKIKEALENVRKAFKNPNLNPSKKQELGKFIESLGWPCVNKTKAGGFKVSKKEFAEWEKMGHSEVRTLIEYSKWMIIWNTFIGADSNYGEDDDGSQDDLEFGVDNFESFDGDEYFSGIEQKAVHHDATGLWQYKGIDNRIHTTFGAFMTKSHRHRCVAKGTKILINRGYDGDPVGVPIEEVRIGDYAFCYDDDCRSVFKRVTWAGKTGRKEVIRLRFLDSCNHKTHLDVTPEHKVRLLNGSYCEARYLLNNTVVLGMRCRDDRLKRLVTLENPTMTSIGYRGDVVDVYDLTVEDTHNFIANEICVSNSSNPNLQNLPKRNKEVSSIVRQCYIPPDIVPCQKEEAVQIWVFDRLNGVSLYAPEDIVEIGFSERIKIPAKDLVNYDFREYGYRAEYYRWAEPGEYFITETDGENLQPKIAASMSHDKNLCNVFLSGGDFHTSNTFHILAKYQLFDDCTITLENGKIISGMEWQQVPVVICNKKEIKEIYYGDIKKGDSIENISVVDIRKISRNVSYEEFCVNAKKGKCKSLRDVGKAIGLSFLFGASANNLGGGTLRMVWNPKMCSDFIRERGLEDLQKQIVQSNKHLKGDALLYYVVASFFRSEFFKLYPELEKWILDCANVASNTGYRSSPWGSRRLLPQLRTKGRDADSGMYKNLCNISVNSPVQDYETVVMSSAMVKIDSMYESLGYISYIAGTVHDSAVAINHRSELESCLRISLEAFKFDHPATYGMPYSGECNVADYTKGEFWGFGHRDVKYKDVKDVVIIRKRYPKR